MKKLYYKIKTGYLPTEFISIEGREELEKALYCFASESKGIFNNGVVRGKDIISITEDYNKAMGWNETYKPTEEDWNYIHRDCDHYKGIMAEAKYKVGELMLRGQDNLIGKKDVTQIA